MRSRDLVAALKNQSTLFVNDDDGKGIIFFCKWNKPTSAQKKYLRKVGFRYNKKYGVYALRTKICVIERIGVYKGFKTKDNVLCCAILPANPLQKTLCIPEVFDEKEFKKMVRLIHKNEPEEPTVMINDSEWLNILTLFGSF